MNEGDRVVSSGAVCTASTCHGRNHNVMMMEGGDEETVCLIDDEQFAPHLRFSVAAVQL